MIYISSTAVAGLTNRHIYQPVLLTTVRTLTGQKFNNIAPLLTTLYEEEQIYQYRWNLLGTLHPDLLQVEFEPPYPPNLLYKEKYYLFSSQIPLNSLTWVDEKMREFTPSKYLSDWDKITPLYSKLKELPEYQLLTTSSSLSSREATVATITLEEKIKEITSDSDELTSLLDRQVTMDRGTRLESVALQKFASKIGLTLRVEEKGRTDTLITPRGYKYKIGGRTDSIILENNRAIGVVECKIRRGRVNSKDSMPGYDVDQLTVYWYLTQYEKYYLVEFHEGEISFQEYSTAELRTRWEQIRPLLDSWVDNIIPVLDRCKNYFQLNSSSPTLLLDEVSERARSLITSL